MVRYTALPAGNYILQVRATDEYGHWSEYVREVQVRIIPYFYKTVWFYLSILILAVLGAWCFYRRKTRRFREQRIELEQKVEERTQKLAVQNRQLEEMAQHVKDVTEEKIAFFTNITHEFRTPVTLIHGPIEHALKEVTDEHVKADLQIAERNSSYLLSLVNELMDFRKLDMDKVTLDRKPCQFVALLSELLLPFKVFAKERQIEIRFFSRVSTPWVLLDAAYMRKALVNLISNAIKYTEKGSITIGIRLAERTGICYTELWVSDTGYGIHPDALPHIFERYYQEGGKHQASGTGIGLALVKNLVKLHEGEISVESKLNQGSTFRISLLTDNFYPNALHTDIQQNDAEKTTEQEPEPNADERPILLVVEDNQDIRDYIAESFSEHFDVRTAANGKEGRDIALKIIPDIIVSDIMMPVMDGNEMCRALKSDVRTSHIPIILLTAKDSLHDKEEGYAVGADSYLTKPFSASLLHSRVMESLNKLDNEFIHKINELIEARLSSDKIDVGYLSDKMCMSSSTLYRKMKALTGMSANEYVRKMKMKYAEQFLLEGKYTISEIAAKVGINNLFYFRQCFKEEYGVIPSEYLKQLREKAGGEPS